VSGIKFEPGQIVATPGALEAFRASGDDPLAYLVRHIAGDWAWGERPLIQLDSSGTVVARPTLPSRARPESRSANRPRSRAFISRVAAIEA
jgi:hypothetical protein